MRKRIGGIYKITNKVDGKFYIGSTVDFNKRRATHRYELKANKHHNEYLQNAYNKYGIENFKFSILEIVENEEELRSKEQYYIDSLDACNRKIGYNLNTNANGGGGAKGERNGWYGKGYLMSGERNHFYGKKHSNETRKKLSEISKKKKGYLNSNYGNKSFKNPLSKQIAQVDINTLKVLRIWGASIDITNQLGLHGGNICKICIHLSKHSERKKYKGFYWCYEEDVEKLLISSDYINPKKRKVIQIDANSKEIINIFDSISSAAKCMEIGAENISRACKGKNETSGGYKWRFEDCNYIYENKNKNYLKGSKNPRSRKVCQLTLDGDYINTYETIKDASVKTNTSVSGLYQCLSKGRASSGGYKWMYKEDYDKYIEDQNKLA